MYDPILDPVYNAFDETFVQEPDLLIKFYEDNAFSFSLVEQFDHENLLKYEAIAGWYMWALVNKKEYKKALQRSVEIAKCIERNCAKLNIDPLKEKWYVNILYQRAYSKFYRYVYRSAHRDFKIVSASDPGNEYLKAWVNVSKYRYYEHALLFISFILIVGHHFYKSFLPLPIKLGLLIIGVICPIVSLRYEYLTRNQWKNGIAPRPRHN